jgi:hypothetical protein
VAYDIEIPEADYIVQAANAYPELVELQPRKMRQSRPRERVALLDGILGERHRES